MAHYAFLDKDNIVTEVIVGVDENEKIEGKTPEEWYTQFRGQLCVRTSYNANIRNKFAAIGDTYDSILDAFISPKPFPSWKLDAATKEWIAPVAKPEGDFFWHEELQSWIPIPENLLEVTE
jgi:hypothetical protein